MHDDTVLDATLHGWDRHDAAVFSRLEKAALEYSKAWNAHDQAVFARMEALPQVRAPAGEVSALREPFAEQWAEHDAAVFAQIENLDGAWAKHDAALFEQTMALLADAPRALAAGWQQHDAAVFSALVGEEEEVQVRRLRARRELARGRSSLKELTTTLVRGLEGAGGAGEGFEEDALSYSV